MRPSILSNPILIKRIRFSPVTPKRIVQISRHDLSGVVNKQIHCLKVYIPAVAGRNTMTTENSAAHLLLQMSWGQRVTAQTYSNARNRLFRFRKLFLRTPEILTKHVRPWGECQPFLFGRDLEEIAAYGKRKWARWEVLVPSFNQMVAD